MRLSEIPGTPFEIPKYGPIVYLIYCIPTKRAYVGSTVQYLLIRWNQHRSEAVGQTRPAAYTSASKLNRAIAKYGPDSFRLSILEETKTEKECRTREIWWIRKLKVTDPAYGYNCMGGYPQRPYPLSLRNGNAHTAREKTRLYLGFEIQHEHLNAIADERTRSIVEQRLFLNKIPSYRRLAIHHEISFERVRQLMTLGLRQIKEHFGK